MQEIKTVIQLKEAIQLLQFKRKEEELGLKNEISILFEKIQPINIIQDTVNELVESKSLQTDVIDLGVGTATGFAIRKLIVGESKNPIAQVIGRMIEQTVSQKIISNRVVIHNIGRNVLNLFSTKTKKEKTK
jgi:hypothetical protein